MSVKPAHFYICVCTYMLGYVRVQGCACLWDMCTRRSKSTSGVIPQVLPIFFFLFETKSLLVWELSGSLNWLGREPRECLSLPSIPGAGITSMCKRTQISYIILGSKVRSLCLQSKQVLYQLTYLLIPINGSEAVCSLT